MSTGQLFGQIAEWGVEGLRACADQPTRGNLELAAILPRLITHARQWERWELARFGPIGTHLLVQETGLSRQSTNSDPGR